MKKTLSYMLCLLILTGLLFVSAGSEAYLSNFDLDLDGWYARSTGQAALEIMDGSIKISGRTQDWNSPGRDFDLVPGRPYEVSVEVFQDEVPSAAFLISVAHTVNGRETYENLVRQDAKKGVWTLLSGGYIAGVFDKFVLYVETLGTPNLSFQIKDFSLQPNHATYAESLPSLKDLYRDYFDFGSAVTGREALNTKLMDFYGTQFNIMTHGNELKSNTKSGFNSLPCVMMLNCVP